MNPFETYVEEYESWFQHNPHAYASELAAIKALMPAGEGLEIGVGTGLFAEPLAIATGVEPASEMAQKASERGIRVLKGYAEDLPCAEAAYDFSLMVTTICFVEDPLKAIKEACRVVRPGGAVLVALVDKKSPLGEDYLKKKEESRFYKNARFYSTQQIHEFVKAAGLEDIMTVQTLFTPLQDMLRSDPVRTGFGKGSFTVIRALRPS